MDILNKIMKLNGGNYGGYELIGENIQLEEVLIPIIYFQNENEFFIVDEISQKWFYRITDSIVFIGINLE